MKELRDKLRNIIDFHEDRKIREQIKLLATQKYIKKYSDHEYVRFMERNLIEIREVPPQSPNNPYYYIMFSIKTQHIYGDTINELFDKAIDIEKLNKTKVMTPQQQKLDIDNVLRCLQSYKHDIENNIKVLKRAQDCIDEGQDMMKDNSILAQEVREIMRNPLNK